MTAYGETLHGRELTQELYAAPHIKTDEMNYSDILADHMHTAPDLCELTQVNARNILRTDSTVMTSAQQMTAPAIL